MLLRFLTDLDEEFEDYAEIGKLSQFKKKILYLKWKLYKDILLKIYKIAFIEYF